MHDHDILAIAALSGLVWLALSIARKVDRAARRVDPWEAHVAAALYVAEPTPALVEAADFELWRRELLPERPVYDVEEDISWMWGAEE